MLSEQVKRVWRLDELAAHVAYVLSVLELVQSSGRVREVPDRRTIRYYTTLGLLTRPVGFRGRTALYGWEHIYQLVAIKRYQVKGLSLSEIQEALLGLPLSEIEQVAAIPASLREEVLLVDAPIGDREGCDEKAENAADKAVSGDVPAVDSRRSFWKQEPVSASSPVSPSNSSRSVGQREVGGDQSAHKLEESRQALRAASESGAIVYQGVVLAAGLKLLLESPARALEEDDVEAIRVAAGPLRKVLEARHLLRAPHDGDQR